VNPHRRKLHLSPEVVKKQKRIVSEQLLIVSEQLRISGERFRILRRTSGIVKERR
jgi:hypothetical protein